MRNSSPNRSPLGASTIVLWASLLILFLTALAHRAYADEPNLSGIDVGELARIQNETILLNAMAARADAERSANADLSEPSQRIQAQPGELQAAAPAPAPSFPRLRDLPVISSIGGSPARMRATLLYSSGFEVEVFTGTSNLPGEYRVAKVSLDGVILERDGKQFQLGFSSQATAAASQASAPTPPAMPGLY